MSLWAAIPVHWKSHRKAAFVLCYVIQFLGSLPLVVYTLLWIICINILGVYKNSGHWEFQVQIEDTNSKIILNQIKWETSQPKAYLYFDVQLMLTFQREKTTAVPQDVED